jgi:hypothetical protein
VQRKRQGGAQTWGSGNWDMSFCVVEIMERGVVNGKMMNPISDISGLKKM